MLTGRLRVLSQKNVQYVAVRDVANLLCPLDPRPLVNLRYIADEYDRPDNIDWSRPVYRCASCALLTSPAGSRLSVTLGLNITDALEMMDYEDDDGEEAAAFISDRMYFQNRERTSTDATYPLEGGLVRASGMTGGFGDSVYFNDHFPIVRKLLVRPILDAFVFS